MRPHFLKSPHHAALAAATLGIGFATGEPLYLVLGAAAYVLGWVYLPDTGFFRNWVARREQEQLARLQAGEVASFQAQRNSTFNALLPMRQHRYSALAEVCRQIEHSIGAADDPRVRKLEELMWTFLRLLSTEQSLEHFLEIERQEDVAGLLAAAQEEVRRLEAEVAELRAGPANAMLESRERLLETRRDFATALQKRAERSQQARHHLELVIAEQERLDQQIKLLRAEAMAAPNTAALSARIDATVEQIETTNHWLREMDQFRATMAETALPEQRVGFGQTLPGVPPPLPVRGRRKERTS